MPNVMLRSSDGEMFEVDVEIAKCSTTIKTMMEYLEIYGAEGEVMSLLNVNSTILIKILEWIYYHKDDLQLLSDDNNQDLKTDNISPWDVEFFNVNQHILYDLIVAANFLDIKGLPEVACKTVENLTKDKTPEEIRNMFSMKKKFVDSEEDQGDGMM